LLFQKKSLFLHRKRSCMRKKLESGDVPNVEPSQLYCEDRFDSPIGGRIFKYGCNVVWLNNRFEYEPWWKHPRYRNYDVPFLSRLTIK